MSRLERSANLADELEISRDARLVAKADGVLEITTPQADWSWAAIGRFRELSTDAETAIGLTLVVDIELISGALGIFVSDDAPNAILGQELVVDRHGRQQITLDQRGRLPTAFCIRSYDRGSARARIFDIRVHVLKTVDITNVLADVLPAMLLEPGDGARMVVAEALSRTSIGRVTAEEIGVLELAPSHALCELPSLSAIFSDTIGRICISETQRLTDLLRTYDPQKLIPNIGSFDLDYLRKYLRQNVIRIYHLAHLLQDLDLQSGSILEIGAFMGGFSASLQQLGYEVTAVDRYAAFDGALHGYTDYMRSLGIRVVETDRANEVRATSELGTFDAVISMAVIEHIPHTAKPFLEMLASHVKPGGILALDTPNIARYWNRRALSSGQSVHQDIEIQFNCVPPYEGHHREYTAAELIWMMEQVGCKDIQLRRFDYNLLQFERLESAHEEALRAMALDPTLTDTILAAGRL